MERKIISINPEILKNYQTKKTRKETTPKLPKQNKTLRKNTYSKILKHLREQQEKKYNQYLNQETENNIEEKNDETQNEQDDFDKTIEFLNENIAIKRGKINQEIEKKIQEQNAGAIQPIILNNIPTSARSSVPVPVPVPILQQQPSQLQNITIQSQPLTFVQSLPPPPPPQYPQYRTDKRKKTIKKTFYLGNMPKLGKISVLIPNKTIRKKILTEKAKFNETPISKIKSFLLRNGFIKAGTTAPDYLLMEMYKNIKMIGGNVINHNVDNLLSGFANQSQTHF